MSARKAVPAKRRPLKNTHKKRKNLQWNMLLYIAGQTPKTVRALANLRRICDEHLAGLYSIEVIDLLVKPRLAKGAQILAVPTLVRHLPAPMRKIIGDMSNTEAVLVGLDLRKRG